MCISASDIDHGHIEMSGGINWRVASDGCFFQVYFWWLVEMTNFWALNLGSLLRQIFGYTRLGCSLKPPETSSQQSYWDKWFSVMASTVHQWAWCHQKRERVPEITVFVVSLENNVWTHSGLGGTWYLTSSFPSISHDLSFWTNQLISQPLINH